MVEYILNIVGCFCLAGMVMSFIGLLRNKWTYSELVRISEVLYSMVRTGEISHEEYMECGKHYPAYDTVAFDFFHWNIYYYLDDYILGLLQRLNKKVVDKQESV